MSDIHALSGAFAVDGLDGPEREQFESHLEHCPVCEAEVDSLVEAACLLGETVSSPAPAHLRAQVLRDITTVRPLPPIARISHIRPRNRRRFPALVAAAAAVIALGAGGAIFHPWSPDPSGPPSAGSSIDQVVHASDAERYVKDLHNGSSTTLVRSPSLGKSVVRTAGIAAPPAGMAYELWYDRDGKFVPAGLLQPGENTLLLDGDAAKATGAGITLEPAEGSSTPTGDMVVSFTFKQA